MYKRLNVKYPLFLIDFQKENSNVKCNENPSSGSRDVLCGQTNTTKQTTAFRSSAH
jgi:hypothetical protein